ncbi:MAG: inorganic phosphate transporter [Gaiellaceae bacterium]|jgi:PiT family inorganic phosphate transporter
MLWITLVAVILIALFFDFTNGFHDSANAIATAVSTRALSPRIAVLMSAVLNFAGAFYAVKVAATIAKGIVNQDLITGVNGLKIILAGLIGAIVWNLTTWYLGLPSSSSHALIGGMLGSVICALGLHANAKGSSQSVVLWHGLYEKVLIPSLLAPLLAIPSALLLMYVFLWIIRKRSPQRTNHVFRRIQPLSSAFVAFLHGTNDAQKTMGVMAMALVAAGHLDPNFSRPPIWVIAGAASAMAFGTYAGGWRIIRTLGTRIAKLDPPRGVAAETACASLLWVTQHYGFPVSTTHTISGAVLGSGAANSRLSAVRWGVAGNIVIAWLITIPCAALVGASVELLTRLPGGVFFALAVAGAAAALALVARHQHLAAGRVMPHEPSAEPQSV